MESKPNINNNNGSNNNGSGDGNVDCVVRVRGLPWQSTREDVVEFFTGTKIKGGVNGVHMTLSREGRPSGEAYVEFDNEEEFNKGVECHKKHMGSRYIEVFPSKKSEMEWITKRNGADPFGEGDACFDNFIRLRGLPFGAKREDVVTFFEGLDIVDAPVLPMDHQGRSTGEAYVQFASREIAEKAMGKHKEKIGHRYIEIFKSTQQEYQAVCNFNFGNFGGGGGGGFGGGGGYDRGPEPMPPHHHQQQQHPHHHMNHQMGGGGGGGMPTGPHYDSPQPHGGGHPDAGPYPPKMRNTFSTYRPSPYDRGGYQHARGGGGQGGGGGFGGGQGGGGGGPTRVASPGARRGGLWDDFNNYRRNFNGRYGGYDEPPQQQQQRPPTPPPFVDNGGHIIHMRGLPYKAANYDIFEFFRPLQPLSVRLLFDDFGRASGEADVEFASHEEAMQGMNKDKAHMQHRYIELFLHSSPSPGLGQPAPVPPPGPVQPPPMFGEPRDHRGYGMSPVPQPVPPPSGANDGFGMGSMNSMGSMGNSMGSMGGNMGGNSMGGGMNIMGGMGLGGRMGGGGHGLPLR